jgi:3-phenylpropionate/trans-cinnamate dioxygenase ferredoxin subunit
MSFIEVAQVTQVPPGIMKSFSAGDRQILVANYDARFYAIDNKCPHAGGSLSEGKLEGKIVTCPIHGSKFDVTTGRGMLGPKIGFIRLKPRDALAYEIRVEGNSLKIDFERPVSK